MIVRVLRDCSGIGHVWNLPRNSVLTAHKGAGYHDAGICFQRLIGPRSDRGTDMEDG